MEAIMTTRSLEGKKFFVDYNNGVSAIISEDVFGNIRRQGDILNAAIRGITGNEEMKIRQQVEEETFHLVTPTFTFVRYNRFREDPHFSGSSRLFERLCKHIRSHGGVINDRRGFHVPFSNGFLHDDYRYVTTVQQFRDTFGISPQELMPEDGPDAGEIIDK